MAIRKLVYYPDPLLKEQTELVTNFDSSLTTLLDDMAETMYASQGIGLAAPQIGELLRVTVIDVGEEKPELIEFINPQIVSANGKTSSEEGCLSIPEYRETVSRNDTITVEAFNRSGEPFTLEADNILAICLQHEIDHLDGVLFTDRLSPLKRRLFKKWYNKVGPFGE